VGGHLIPQLDLQRASSFFAIVKCRSAAMVVRPSPHPCPSRGTPVAAQTAPAANTANQDIQPRRRFNRSPACSRPNARLYWASPHKVGGLSLMARPPQEPWSLQHSAIWQRRVATFARGSAGKPPSVSSAIENARPRPTEPHNVRQARPQTPRIRRVVRRRTLESVTFFYCPGGAAAPFFTTRLFHITRRPTRTSPPPPSTLTPHARQRNPHRARVCPS
jgi:hypothetical protein